MMMRSREQVLMPDGSPFPFWDDRTTYARTYHVAQQHPDASDQNAGSQDRPFATISRAAQGLQPGEKVIVHEGVYRECVRPARGGDGPERMIAYEAADDEAVTVSGAAEWTPQATPSQRLGLDQADNGATIWMATMPADLFGGYNPFLANNMNPGYSYWGWPHTVERTDRFLMRRGALFYRGRPLTQVQRPGALARRAGAWWVEEPGLRVHFRLPDDLDPANVTLEVTAREQVFAPDHDGCHYIRVTGFTFTQGANGVPLPQRGIVSTHRGGHWIIEDNTITHANSIGLDFGTQAQGGSAPPCPDCQGHVIRRNRMAHCGISGMAGVAGGTHSLFEDNVIEHCGHLDLERMYESAALKLHFSEGALIRRNVFRHLKTACGVWLDVPKANNRVTGNVFADIQSIKGGCYLEVSFHPNLIDHNVFWDIRKPPDDPYEAEGCAVLLDSTDQAIVAHNLIAHIPHNYAVRAEVRQPRTLIGGRAGLSRGIRVLNNILAYCSKRVLLREIADNVCDGNLYDQKDDQAPFCLQTPAPEAWINLDAWQRYFGMDAHGVQAKIQCLFDLERLTLSLDVEGPWPECVAVPELHHDPALLRPGPLSDREEVQTGSALAAFRHVLPGPVGRR